MKILFTREMSAFELDLASRLGLDSISVPLIAFEFVGWDGILSEQPDFWDELSAAKAVVFTSRNGVRGVTGDREIADKVADKILSSGLTSSGNRKTMVTEGTGIDGNNSGRNSIDGVADKSITDATLSGVSNSDETITQKFLQIIKKKPVYTVGESTADALEPFGILARFPDDYNATTLSKMMLMDGVHTRIMHFCGDVRRPELGMAMNDANIDVKEVIVYQKKELQATHVSELPTFDAVVFYSPSAVQAFFGQKLNENFRGEWFAIGQTTATALRDHGIEPLVPRASTSELLIEYVAKCFKSVN